MPGADEHERAGAPELGEPGFHRRGVPRALEHDVERRVDDVVR